MGEFDFGAFQQLFEYLAGKLSEGGALTPEEKTAYDGLLSIANQGLNLTETADFKSLYTAFNTLADSETKKKFEELYGTGLISDPATGAIQFTRPGTLVAAMMRRGLSVNDGPVQALLSEGLKNFVDTTAKNSFAAMTNSYQAMTPIRGQNIQAFQGAGNIGSTAIGRRGAVAPAAIGGGRAGAGEGAGEGVGPEGLNLPPPPKGPEAPSAWDKIWPILLGIGGTAGGAVLTKYLSGLLGGDKDGKTAAAAVGVEGQPQYGQGAMRQTDVYDYEAPKTPAYNPYEVSQSAFQAAPEQPQYNPYEVSQLAFQSQPDQQMEMGSNYPPANYQDYGWWPTNNQFYGSMGQGPQPSDASYGEQGGWGGGQSWTPPQQNYEYSFQDYADYGDQYNPNYSNAGSNQDSWGSDYDYSYSDGGGGGDTYYPSSDDWYSENY